MDRQTLLVIDPLAERRRALAVGLSEFAYEVAPAARLDQGLAFAHGLAPAVVVVTGEPDTPAEGYTALFELAARDGCTLLFLPATAEQEEAAPDRALVLPLAGSAGDVLVDRVRLLLLGRALALDVEVEGGALIGDLSRRRLFELIPRFRELALGGRLELPGGVIGLERGAVVAARCGAVAGAKAFRRLATTQAEGIFRFVPGDDAGARDVEIETGELLHAALDDATVSFPDRRARIELKLSRELFDATLTPLQREILAAVGEGIEVGRLLDSIAEPDGEIAREIERLIERRLVEMRAVREAVAVVTDSAADLPLALLKREGIHLVPLSVIFGRQTYRDAVDLSPRQFYDLLGSRASHPSTQPPSVEDFAGLYRKLAGASAVLSIHLSHRMSLTGEHAGLAAEAVRRDPAEGDSAAAPKIRTIDSEQCSLPLGLLALFAARMAARELPAEEIARRIEGMRRRVGSMFVVDTLEYLVRGGRIGRARALVGQLLGIKPILGLADGEVGPVDRVRGGRAAQKRMVELLKGKIDPARPVIAGVAHAAAPLWAERLETLLRAEFSIAELVVSEMGPIVGAHVGPGTVGAVVFQPTADELPLIAPLG